MSPYNPRKKRGRFWWFILIAVIIAGGGIFLRLHNAWALRKETQEDAITQVVVINPKPGASEEDLVVPGNITAWHEATIYARTNGYMKRWYTPMGTAVKEGDVLADIETPEIDAKLRQAEADVKTAEANNTLAQLTTKRWKALRKTDSVSKQEADEKLGDAMAKEAALASAIANRDHLRELSSFKQVRAPFDGVISSRTTDIGMLVNAGSDTQQPLFRIVQADRLRVYVRVPQSDAARITPEAKAEVHFADHPGEAFPASFVKTAEALDPTNRTLLVEFMIDNKDGKLFAGGFGEVHIKLPAVATSLRLPVNTLLFRAEGLQVAVVDAQNHAQLRKVTMGRDFGTTVEIAAGVTAQDKVIVNPPDSLANDQPVRVITPKESGDKKPDDAAKKDAK